MGPVTSYPAGARLVSNLGALKLDHGALATLENGTKCDLERDQVLFYEGTLWLEEGSTELTTERFTYLDGVATLLVEGVVAIDDAVEPALLFEKLAKVHNSGTIRCTPPQMGALQARMDRNEGALVDSTAAEEEESAGVGNIGFLTL